MVTCASSFTGISGTLCCSDKEQDLGGFPPAGEEAWACNGSCGRFYPLEDDPDPSETEDDILDEWSDTIEDWVM